MSSDHTVPKSCTTIRVKHDNHDFKGQANGWRVGPDSGCYSSAFAGKALAGELLQKAYQAFMRLSQLRRIYPVGDPSF